MIRKFEPGDLNRVMQLWLDGNREAHDFIPAAYWVSNFDMVKAALLQAEVLVYEADGVVRGFAGMQGDYLAGIFVEQSHRSTGIGTRLLDRLKEEYPAFSLQVYGQNHRAVQFYLREGLTIASAEQDEDTGCMEYTMQWNRGGMKKEEGAK